MTTLTENRLTAEDRNAMWTRVLDTLSMWGKDYRPGPADMAALERVAHHAIGCSADDLRDCELTEIEAMVREIAF